MIYAACVQMHMCSALFLSHTLSLLPLSFLSVFTSRFLFLHMLISHLFSWAGPLTQSPQYQMSAQTKQEEVLATRYEDES